jgi:hypothetical protein
MSFIIYADSLTDFEGNNFTHELLKNKFAPAIQLNKKIQDRCYKIAYMFIDPLMDSFEAANRFYFNVLGCSEVSRLNVYRSGCGPVQAVSDAQMLISSKIYDAVFIFGYEPLATLKIQKGKKTLSNSMDIYNGVLLPEAYNRLAHHLLEVLNLTKEQFWSISDSLYDNYKRTYYGANKENSNPDRNKLLEDINADLFTLTDCSNPYVDFAGGVVVSTEEVANELKVTKQEITEIKGAEYNVVGDGPDYISTIVGTEEEIYPHLKKAYTRACTNAGVDFVAEFKKHNALLETYTCYPPTPMAFLLSTGFVGNIDKMKDFLAGNEITVTGGMNFSRGPWNNPALNGLIAMHKSLKENDKRYGLVHGNGGLGGFQGVILLSH